MNISRAVLEALARRRVMSVVELAAHLGQEEGRTRTAISSLRKRGQLVGERFGSSEKHYAITALGRYALTRPARAEKVPRASVRRVNSVFQLGERA